MGFTINFFSYARLISLFEEIFIEEIYSFNSSSSAPFIIDCGSHIGMSILYFKYQYPDSRILAFEPDERNFDLLDMTIEQNNLSRVNVKNVALSRENSKRIFFEANEPDSLNNSLIRTSQHYTSTVIRTSRLSDYITEKADLIKIDVEGVEDEIIEEVISAGKLSSTDQIVVEYHTQCATSLEDLVSSFDKAGFKPIYRKRIDAKHSRQILFKK